MLAQVAQIAPESMPLSVKASVIQSDNINPTLDIDMSATGLLLNPQGQLVSRAEGVDLQFNYAGKLEVYSVQDPAAGMDDSVDFNGVEARLLSRFYIADAWSFDIAAEHKTETQKFGTGISRLSKDIYTPDTLKRNTGKATLIYGRKPSDRFIALSSGVEDYRYDTQEDSDIFDLTVTYVTLHTGFRFSPQSRLLTRLEAYQEDFDNVQREDSEFYQALVGFDWQVSGKSSLELLVGLYQRSFDVSEDNNGLVWVFNYAYQPNSVWSFELGSSRQSEVSESELTSDMVSQDLLASLHFTPLEQWRLSASTELVDTTFYQAGSELNQDEMRAALQLSYLFSRHQSVGVSVSTNNIETSDTRIDYRQNEVAITWQYEF